MLEKSGMDEADINSQRIEAVRSLIERWTITPNVPKWKRLAHKPCRAKTT